MVRRPAARLMVGWVLLAARPLLAQAAVAPALSTPRASEAALTALAGGAELWPQASRQLDALTEADLLEVLTIAVANRGQPLNLAARAVDLTLARAAAPRRAALASALAARLSAPGLRPEEVDLLLWLAGRYPAAAWTGPLTRLLADPLRREAARQALQADPSGSATAALRAALQAALLGTEEPAWVDALFVTLAQRGDEELLPLLAVRLRSPDEASARAAMAALARLGDARGLGPLEVVWQSGNAALRAPAMGALLELARLQATTLELRQRVRSWLAGELAPQERSAALSLLAAGGADAVPGLVAALSDAAAPVRAQASRLLSLLRGPGVAEALLAAMATAPEPAQMPLLAAVGAHAGPSTEAALLQLLEGTSLALRREAIAQLARLGGADTVAALQARFAGEGTDLRRDIVRALLRIAARQASTDRDSALATALKALEYADEPNLRSAALSVLAPLAGADQFEVVAPFLEANGTRRAAAKVALAIAAALTARGAAGDRDEAIAVLGAVAQRGGREYAAVAAGRLAALGIIDEPARANGFVTRWWILGPFPNAAGDAATTPWPPEQEVDLAGSVTLDRRQLRWRWQPISSPDGTLSLLPAFEPNIDVTAYAYTEVTVSQEQMVTAKLGSDDGAVLWLNGQVIYREQGPRSLVIDQDAFTAHLQAGRNRLLLKVRQEQGDWGFALRLLNADGTSLEYQPLAPPSN